MNSLLLAGLNGRVPVPPESDFLSVDGAGNIRFRVVGYATTWGLKARLWWAANVAA
jgi:hypothetical protein